MSTRYCTQCGCEIPENSRFCTNCGAMVNNAPANDSYSEPQYEQPAYATSKPTPTTPKPNSYLALSILATIFCCLPFGIPAIVFSARVNNLWAAGDYVGAEEASRKAKIWMLVSVITGVVVTVIYTILMTAGIFGAGLGLAGLLEGLNY